MWYTWPPKFQDTCFTVIYFFVLDNSRGSDLSLTAFFFFFFLAAAEVAACGLLAESSSLSRDGTWARCIGSMES